MRSAFCRGRYRPSAARDLGPINHVGDLGILEMLRPTDGRAVVLCILDSAIRATREQQFGAIGAALPACRDVQRRDAARAAEACATVDVGAAVEEPSRGFQ